MSSQASKAIQKQSLEKQDIPKFDSLEGFVENLKQYPNIEFEYITESKDIKKILKYCNPDKFGKPEKFEKTIPHDLDMPVFIVADNYSWNRTYLPELMLAALLEKEGIANGTSKVKIVFCNNPLFRVWLAENKYPEKMVQEFDLTDDDAVNKIERAHIPFILGINPLKEKTKSENPDENWKHAIIIEGYFSLIWYSNVQELIEYLKIK